ncbi:MAG: sulfur carrier protein ThiS [Pseudomonadota bacterium]
MKIVLNGDTRNVSAATLADLLVECGVTGRVATAVNEDFVPAALREDHKIKDGDRIEIVAPMQGG